MPLTDSSIPAALREQVRQQPDAPAYTFVDYEVDPAGYSQSLTWSQLHRRAQVVAAELASCGSPGDRAAILAPQGVEYIVGVLGAMEAGFIAVPLSVPLFGALDERVVAALSDSSPAAILTTSAVVNDVVSCAHALPGSPPAVIEIDALDLFSPPAFHSADTPQTKTALLQYTSGSTRAPAGVVVTHKNVMANLNQIMSDYFEERRRGSAVGRHARVVAALLPRHGPDAGNLRYPVRFGTPSVLTSPMAFLQKPARWMQLAGAAILTTCLGRPQLRLRIGRAPNLRRRHGGARPRRRARNRQRQRTSPRRDRQAVHRAVSPASTSEHRDPTRPTGSPRRRCTWRVEPGAPPRRSSDSTTRSCRPVTRSAAATNSPVRADQLRCATRIHRAHRRPRDRARESGRQGR